MRILFWAGSDDGSSWYRCTQPSIALRWLGHQAVVKTAVTMADLEWCEVAVISRPARASAHKAISILQDAGKRVYADIDDDFWKIDDSNRAAKTFWTPTMLGGLSHGICMCDGLIAPSKALADGFPGHGHVVPNGLNAAWLQAPRDYNKRDLVLGWSGSANTATWLPKISYAVNRVLREYKSVKFLAVGASHERLESAGFDMVPGRVGAIQWAPHGDGYLRTVASFDIWLAPYGGTPFDQAKFPTKALEAGMLGIPLIVSTGMRGYIEWTEGTAAYVPSGDDEWYSSMQYLLDVRGRRLLYGRNNASRAARNVMQHLALDWERVLTGGKQ